MAVAAPDIDIVLSQVEQIRAFNRHLFVAVNQVESGVLIVEAEPARGDGPPIIFANNAVLRMTGLTMEEMLENPIASLFNRESLPNFAERLPATAVTGKTYTMDIETVSPEGGFATRRWKIKCLRDRVGTPENYVFTISDVPENLELAPEADSPDSAGCDDRDEEPDNLFVPDLGLNKEEQDQIEKSKQETLALVASGIAHDFRNFLTSVLANLSLVKMETDSECPAMRYLDAALTASENAEALTQQLLRYARGRGPDRELVDVGEILHEAKRLATYGSNTRCEVTVDSDLGLASVSRTQITQVINNLLINARQSMPSGGVIQASAENAELDSGTDLALPPGRYILIRVRDRGCGIPEEDIENIFKPFFTKKKEGSGLGLATCYSIVIQHAGLITVRSKVDVGTEFRVYLPAWDCQDGEFETPEINGNSGRNRASACDDEEEVEEVVHGQGSVLVVDDQADVRIVASAILQKVGYEVVEAETGEAGLQIYGARLNSGRPFCVVLMDMTLPGGMSGQEAAKEMLALNPMASVLATSGFFEDSAEASLLNMGFCGILPKPYNAVTLSQAIATTIAQDGD